MRYVVNTVVNLRAIGKIVTIYNYDEAMGGIVTVRWVEDNEELFLAIRLESGIMKWLDEEQATAPCQAKLPALAQRILIQLLTHQVRGEHMTQGLKVNQCQLDVKIREDYLGGWLITLDDRRITPAQLLRFAIGETAQD